MRRYYILLDYIVPVYTDRGVGGIWMTGPLRSEAEYKRDLYREPPFTGAPKTRRLLEVEADVVLYVSYYDVDVGHFTIGTRSRSKAYQLATILRAMFSLFHGWQPDDRTGEYFLQEVKRLPRSDWDVKRMIAELQELNYGIFEDFGYELRRGYQISYEVFNIVPEFVKRIWGDTAVIEALDHMLESRFLFCGFMVSSYYVCHYARDRIAIPDWEMEKRYFESRYRYETAFLAAFKGIERFFGVNQIQKKNLDRLLETKRSLGICPDTIYKRYHEIFSGHEEHVTYKHLLSHFLDLRNTVAAHSNRNPPEHAKLIEDNVFEIQLFLFQLLGKAIYPDEQKTQQEGIPDGGSAAAQNL